MVTILGVCGSTYDCTLKRLGSKRTGKDEVARIASTHFGFTALGLGDTIKSCFDDMDGRERFLSKELDENSWSKRKGWQIFGTEAREDAGFNPAWVQITLIKINYLAKYHPVPRARFIIPDFRFGFEQDLVQQWAAERGWVFRLIHVKRMLKKDDPAEKSFSLSDSQHSSEQRTGELNPHIILLNDTPTLSEFHSKSHKLIEEIVIQTEDIDAYF